MGHQLKVWQGAKEYTLTDNFFMGAFGSYAQKLVTG